jgi:transcriptional regulator with XRE-family HTH domain
MSQVDLSRKFGLDTGWISNLMSGIKQLGLKSLIGLSRSLGVPTDALRHSAGFLPPAPPKIEQSEKLLYLFEQLKAKDRQTILDTMEFFLDK